MVIWQAVEEASSIKTLMERKNSSAPRHFETLDSVCSLLDIIFQKALEEKITNEWAQWKEKIQEYI